MKRLVEYNPDWKQYYRHEAHRLSQWLGDAMVATHHMGSTAIANMPAKPVIDILIEATSLDAIDAQSNILAEQSYEARGEYGIKGRRYFKKSPTGDSPGFHAHAYLAESFQIKRHLAFRDYLCAKPDIAQKYARIKQELSDDDGNLSPDYQAKKASFVDQTSLVALKYFSGK